ncbi:MAG: glycoside hydrolase family 57 protein [Candidatus Parvarchaeota archaeon]|nr:glycoside hydrolase family 57 protein [Candidatus Jingweiarchaeum tengchongense]MCW1297773.1 glycoside hydrolase family 57 protein [Candidatus Jingweiarchaeum tengchongense]MCW1299783.1 glycoside hydrolase family 57 protein [Candidatus Jingweiarchaeum tengchongense]MCW1304246.1 glycoside hydrolase family 57 protein [Candidatus Jingweiarchaeum tengchongense]MCW1305274.1 glycoside hydrolase family 57 protein [Candidatus Jingweiarchaeum tengchongense]
MASVCLFFEVHQPLRLNWFDTSNTYVSDYKQLIDKYFNMGLNKYVFDKVANRCYFPTNRIILELLDKFKSEKKKFKVSYGISGVWIEQCEKFNKDLLDTFKQLADTGCVEFVDNTYYHSLSSLFDINRTEFIEQVKMHSELMKDLFGQRPTFFENTEFIYNNLIAKTVEGLGYKGMFTEGVDWILGWRSPDYVYKPKFCDKLKLLLRNYRISDDIGYRFSSRDFDQWPITAEKYAAWLAANPGQCVNICIDYETFGEHHWAESGIFWFLKALPYQVLKYDNLEFCTPTEIVEKYQPVGEIDVFEYNTISWADMERDTSAWISNKMQQVCYNEVKSLEKYVKATGDRDLLHIWRLLQISDHYYYLCTKWWGDGDVHHYFSHIKNPYEGFINFLTIISDFKSRVMEELMKKNITVK